MEMMKGAINKKDWSRICTMVPHRYAGDLPMGMVIALLWTAGLSKSACAQSSYHPTIPKVWDEVALRDWATPIAGLNLRPTPPIFLLSNTIRYRSRICERIRFTFPAANRPAIGKCCSTWDLSP